MAERLGGAYGHDATSLANCRLSRNYNRIDKDAARHCDVLMHHDVCKGQTSCTHSRSLAERLTANLFVGHDLPLLVSVGTL